MGPGNKWPNAQATGETINKTISRVITAVVFLKLTFQNFPPPQPRLLGPCLVSLMGSVQTIFRHNGKKVELSEEG